MPHPDFNPPSRRVKLTARKSTITGLFFVSLTPCIEPTEADVNEALSILGMSPGNVTCAYCGDAKSEWDHFRPVVRNRAPTGYITEIANLVPSCGKCNQSKSGADWRLWITGRAKLSPLTRGIADLQSRIECLERYESWRKPIRLDFSAILGPVRWQRHLAHLDKILEGLSEAESEAQHLRQEVELLVREGRG